MARNTKKILVIPHQPYRGLKVRALEMAHYLAEEKGYDVSILTWEAGKNTSGLLEKILTRAQEAIVTSLRPKRFEKEQNLTWVTIPYLTAPAPFCQAFNKLQLENLIRHQHYEIVISANAYLFPVPENFKGLYLYDVVDDHLSPDSGPAWKKTRNFTLGELRKAQRGITISQSLRTLLEQEGYPNIQVLPNGVNIQAFRNVTPAAVQAVRNNRRLEGKFVVSFIGNHGWWSGMEFMLEAFRMFHAAFPQSRLLVVGPGEGLEGLKQRYPDESICFTGPVSPDEVNAYFHASDIGVLPFQPCPFTNHALPLKILEYGAAHKQVLASPLKELQTLQFPHVRLLDLDQGAWVNALQKSAQAWQMKESQWNESWNSVIGKYDWRLIWQQLKPLLET